MSETESRINDLTAEIGRLTKQRFEILQEWALQVSPWKVGEITGVRGYSFNGKQCKIKSVLGKLDYRHEPEIRVTATVLKQDGTEGRNTTDWRWRPGEDK